MAKKERLCYFCGKRVTEQDWCFGCEHYVCLPCYGDPPLFGHKLEDHPGISCSTYMAGVEIGGKNE